MKPKIDMKYLKVSLYVIFTVVVIYFLSKLVNLVAYVAANFSNVVGSLAKGFGNIMGIFSVVITAGIIAYLLDPVVGFFEKKYDSFSEKKLSPFMDKHFGKNKHYIKRKKKKEKSDKITRTAGTIITYVTVFAVITAVILFIYTNIFGGADISINNSSKFTNWIVTSINQSVNALKQFKDSFNTNSMNSKIPDLISNVMNSLISFLQDIIVKFSTSIVNSLTSAGVVILDFMMSLVIAFYFLKDKNVILNRANDTMSTFLPKKLNLYIKTLFGDINAVFSGYVRAQIIDAIIVGTIISVDLSVIGVKFGLFIGIFAGIANLIPYFGSIVAFTLSVIISLITAGPNQAIVAGLSILVIQQLDGMFIVPKIVGEKVKLSPALVLISLSVFGSLFGIAGMIFAVPCFAIGKIYLRRLKERKQLKNIEKEAEL